MKTPMPFDEWLKLEPEAAADWLAEFHGYDKIKRDYVASLLKDPDQKKIMVQFVQGCMVVQNQSN